MNRVLQSHGANNIALNRWVKGRNYQQWTFNCVDKTIRSYHWKNYAMEIQSNGGSSNLRTTSTINSRWWQLFRLDGAFIVNERGKVLDVSGGVDAENRNIIVYNRHGKINQ
jgi:hypothetical protein